MKPVAFSNTSDVPPGRSVPWPDPPSPNDERFDGVVGIVTATFTLAGASLLVVWLWIPGQSPGRDYSSASPSPRRNPAARQSTAAPEGSVGTAESVQETAALRTRLVPSNWMGAAAVLARDGERRREPRPDTNTIAGYDRRAAVQGRTAGLVVLSQPEGARITINGVG